MSGAIVAPVMRDLEGLARSLADWLALRMPDARAIAVADLDYPRGAGQSHETILFTARWQEDGRGQSRAMVVRIQPQSHMMFPDILFEQQYRLMRHLFADGQVKVAEPLWFERDEAILGAPFFVMAKVQGRVPVSVPPYAETGWVADATPAQRALMWENGVKQMAAVQRVPTAGLEFLAGTGDAHSGLAQEWDKYVRFVRWLQADHRWPVLDAGLNRLQQNWPAHQPAGLVWGDARLGNIMFDQDFGVVAVMDWEQPSLGGALQDLSWWLTLSQNMHGARPGRPHLAGMGSREETIALWQEEAGILATGIEWYEDFTALKLSCLNIRMASLRGTALPDPAWLAQRMKV